jgi:uncharacterized cupredoxin-like copper-binding protein
MQRRIWLAIAAIGLVVAGCGGGGSSIEATATEYAFDPAAWTVTAGEEVTLTLTNEGAAEHEWALLSEEIASEAEFSEDLVIWEMEAASGASAQGTFTAPAAGTYQVVCVIPGHFDSGMEGALTVEG